MAEQDELYAKAVQVVVRDNKGSTSYLQRRLQIGYNSAARLVEQMEQNGVLSGPDHRGVRTVLITVDTIPKHVAQTGELTHDTTTNTKTEGHSVAKSGFAKDVLKSFINRIERLEEEKSALAADIREVFSEAKGTGFCTKTMRKVIALRRLDKADFQEQTAMLELYLESMDMR